MRQWLGPARSPPRAQRQREEALVEGGSVAKPPGPGGFSVLSRNEARDSRPGIRRLRSAPCPCSMAKHRPCPPPDDAHLLHVFRQFADEAEAASQTRSWELNCPTRSNKYELITRNRHLKLDRGRLLLPAYPSPTAAFPAPWERRPVTRSTIEIVSVTEALVPGAGGKASDHRHHDLLTTAAKGGGGGGGFDEQGWIAVLRRRQAGGSHHQLRAARRPMGQGNHLLLGSTNKDAQETSTCKVNAFSSGWMKAMRSSQTC